MQSTVVLKLESYGRTRRDGSSPSKTTLEFLLALGILVNIAIYVLYESFNIIQFRLPIYINLAF